MTEKNRYTLQTALPVGVIISLLLQAGATIWFASDASTRLSAVEIDLKEHDRLGGHNGLENRVAVIEALLPVLRDGLANIDKKLDRMNNTRG